MPKWAGCTSCDDTGELVCIECLGVGEHPDEDGVICDWCLGDGVTQCDNCDGAGGWYEE